MYLFDTHYGKSSLADDETGIVIHWTNGDFNATNKVSIDPTSRISEHDADLASFVAKKVREMADYIAENYPELV